MPEEGLGPSTYHQYSHWTKRTKRIDITASDNETAYLTRYKLPRQLATVIKGTVKFADA